MHSRYTDVSDLHVSVYASSYLKFTVSVQVEHVHYFGRGALDRFQDHVVRFRSFELHDLKKLLLHFIFEGLLAQFTLECLPKEALDPLTLVNQLLAVQPFPQAVDVDVLHRACAVAGTNQLVFLIVVIAQTNPADFGCPAGQTLDPLMGL